MKIKPAYIISAAIVVVILLWFAYGTLVRGDTDPNITTNASSSEKELPSVVFRRVSAKSHASYMNLHGSTEAVREVAVKAETAGLVVRTPVAEGRTVKRGTLLCQQDLDARQAVLDQANAFLRTRELEYQAAQTLVDKGYRSSTQAAAALAALDGAKASVKQAEIEIGNVNMRAPFDGVFDQQMAEIGEYLAPGQPCGLLIDLDPLLIVGEATEKQIGLLKIGQKSDIKLATGQSLQGKVRFIESKANPATRTFRVEVEVPNKDNSLKAGVTASLKLSAGESNAHLIPAGVLALDDQGRLGVRYIDSQDIVQFTTVQTIDETPDGMWVTGLAETTDLIVIGQDYVSAGSLVTPIDINSVSNESGAEQ